MDRSNSAPRFVRAVHVGYDQIEFRINWPEESDCRFCGGPAVVTYPVTGSERSEMFLCESCDVLVTAQDVNALEKDWVKRAANSNLVPHENVPVALALIRASRREAVLWQRNDFLITDWDMIQPGSNGVNGSSNGLSNDCHEYLANLKRPSPLEEYQSRRGDFRARYSFAIPNAPALDALERFAPDGIVDFGAGNGYWAFLLKRRGNIEALAIDVATVETSATWFPRTPEFKPFSWTSVHVGDARKIGKIGRNKALLLVWPPPKDSMATHALQQFCGDTVIYVGQRGQEWASAGFFQSLDQDWALVHSVAIPNFCFLDDRLFVYRRN